MEKYIHPRDVKPKEDNVPISARVRKGLVKDLKELALINQNPLSGFIEKVLEEYVVWAKIEMRIENENQ